MRETKEIHRLFERLCLKFNVPMPTFFLLDRKPQKTEFGFLHNSTSYFYQLPEDFEDPLGIIFLSRGINEAFVIHEFLHEFLHSPDKDRRLQQIIANAQSRGWTVKLHKYLICTHDNTTRPAKQHLEDEGFKTIALGYDIDAEQNFKKAINEIYRRFVLKYLKPKYHNDSRFQTRLFDFMYSYSIEGLIDRDLEELYRIYCRDVKEHSSCDYG